MSWRNIIVQANRDNYDGSRSYMALPRDWDLRHEDYESEPVYTGAEQMLDSPPLIVCPWPISQPGVDTAQIAVAVADKINRRVFSIRVEPRWIVGQREWDRSKPDIYQTHPWMTTNFLNYMFGSVCGEPGLSTLNSILRTASLADLETPFEYPTLELALRARARVQNPSPEQPPVATRFWSALACALSPHPWRPTTGHQAFIRTWRRLQLGQAYHDLYLYCKKVRRSDAEDHPDKGLPTTNSMHSTTFPDFFVWVANGLWCRKSRGIVPSALIEREIKSCDDLVHLANTFTSGILVLLDPSAFSDENLGHNRVALPYMLKTLNKEVPALRQACEILEQRVVQPLTNGDADALMRLSKFQVNDGYRQGSFLARVRRIPGPSSEH